MSRSQRPSSSTSSSRSSKASCASKNRPSLNSATPSPNRDGIWVTSLSLPIHHHASDRLAGVHEVERAVDVDQRHGGGHHLVELDATLHVLVDHARQLRAPARAAERGATPGAPG